MDLKSVDARELPLVGSSYALKLEKLGIFSVWDLFHHIPFRFLDFSKNINISDMKIGETATIKGVVTSYVNQYTKKGKPMQIVTIADETGKVNAIWFNQIYLSRTFKKGTQVAIAGEFGWFGRNKAIVAPEYEIINLGGDQIHTGTLVPIYNSTAGISSKWLRRKIHDAWKVYSDDFLEFLPEAILKKYDLVDLKTAIHDIHFPASIAHFEKAKRRLAFNELLQLHTANIKNKKKWSKNKGTGIKYQDSSVKNFIKNLPFELTNSQKKVVNETGTDLTKDTPMNRLLEGDVGSGKTVVAAIAAYEVVLSKKKVIFMAPTLILANQHFETLKNLFRGEKIRVDLATSQKKFSGDFDILVGTHSLLNISNITKDVALIVIDEQHKFGVEQRKKLIDSNSSGQLPHLLSMTATPIPRSVALTFFGDLDLSILNEVPTNRQKVTTWIVPEEKRVGAYSWIKSQITTYHSQAFIVCPLIEDSDSETLLLVKAVKSEFEKMEKEFKNFKVGLIHGKLKNTEKEKVIEEFRQGSINILVATPVVEVGVDISNATIMLIEAADRFGLAGLHQLRGRVGRGEKKSYCLLLTENDSEKAQNRLTALKENHSGFELAEIDLKMRGPGEIFGTRQSGIPELKIADWSDVDLIKNTRIVAGSLR